MGGMLGYALATFLGCKCGFLYTWRDGEREEGKERERETLIKSQNSGRDRDTGNVKLYEVMRCDVIYSIAIPCTIPYGVVFSELEHFIRRQ